MMESFQHSSKTAVTSNDDSEPKCRFGVLADIQYADVDNDTNFEKTKVRYFRRALQLVKTAAVDWLAEPNKIQFILQLGDLIDGRNASVGASKSALNAVRKQLAKVDVPVYDIIGNHELYNFSRTEISLDGWFNTASNHQDSFANYHFSPADGFRIVVLDQYEFSLLGIDEDSMTYRSAYRLLTNYNNNSDLNSPDGLRGDLRRFVKFNGAVSEGQLNWLNKVLEQAHRDRELVLVAGHLPICSDVSDSICLCWNYKEILQVLHRYQCVLAYFAGHTHDFAYHQDSNGLHHVVFPGVIETPPNYLMCHSTVSVYEDRFVISSHNDVMPDIIEIGLRRNSLQF